MKSSPSHYLNRGPSPDQQQVAVAAYHLYLERGGGDGHDVEDWLRAEGALARRLLDEVRRSKAKSIPPPSPLQPVTHFSTTPRLPMIREKGGGTNREAIRRQNSASPPASGH